MHKIATFPTHIHGAAAHFDLLNRSYTGMTLQKAIEKWCGNYYSSTYLKVLKDRAGVDENTVLTKAMLADHEIAIPIAKAMAWQEAGQDYPLKDEEWIEAHQMAMGVETTAPGWNPRNDVPTPKRETRLAPVWNRIKAAFAALGTFGVVGVSGSLDTAWIRPRPQASSRTSCTWASGPRPCPIRNGRCSGWARWCLPAWR